jgi:hypothetical protein
MGYLSSLRDRAGDVRDDAEDYSRRAGRQLRDRGDDARSELSRLWGQLEDLVERRLGPAASEAAGQARGYAQAAGGYARDGRDMAMDVAEQLREVTRSRPLVAIGIAVAATWLITSMLRSKR